MLHLDEANKLAQELSDRKKELNATTFGNKLALFQPIASKDDVSIGELAFVPIQPPFSTLDMASADLKTIDIRAEYDFLLALNHCQCIVIFKHIVSYYTGYSTQMSCFDWLRRQAGTRCRRRTRDPMRS